MKPLPPRRAVSRVRAAPSLAAIPVLLGMVACGGGGSEPSATATTTTATPAATPVATQPPNAPTAAFAAVESTAASAFARSGVAGMTLVIHDRDARRVFERSYGDFAANRRVAVASASKLVAATILLRLVDQGFLSLDSTTGSVLGWNGPGATVTLRHLLSFTSGLAPTATCTASVATTLARCVQDIAATVPLAAPGQRFDYGNTHLQVAARMAEVATGTGWAEIVERQLRSPLGLPTGLAWYTLPRQSLGTQNPLVAGGLRASVDDYARVLGLVFARGEYDGARLASAALFEAQARMPYPSATIGFTPLPDSRYGLGAWLECPTPATGCATLSSPGAFGFTPWVDRDAGYYAILGMETDDAGTDGVTEFSVTLSRTLRPLIRSALGR
jgi:CubicO group peptidase (beta-lactamase class C family)